MGIVAFGRAVAGSPRVPAPAAPACSSGAGSRTDPAIYIIIGVGKANVSRQALVEAIATLEAQRGMAGSEGDLDRAVETVLLLLRDKLERNQAQPGDRQRQQLAVLVADLSGYTALSEHMDAERLGDALNSMWRVLDGVIRAWGGQIDQHAGDSLMAVFGLPHPRQGDVPRALLAALAMQRELELFNERARHAAGDPAGPSWAGGWPGPDMRIGVHSGIVYYAHAPDNGAARRGRGAARGEYNVVGDVYAVGETIAVAHRLEELAPAGGVLASATAAREAHNRFIFEPFAGSHADTDEEKALLVIGERSAPMEYQPGTVAGQTTRLVGRAEQLDRLQLALQAADDSRAPQLVTIAGPAGVGKSRLVHEFIGQARLSAGSPTILRAGTQGAHRGHPFALVRDLLLRRFNLHPQDSRYLIEHKIASGLAEIGGDAADDDHHEPAARALELLVKLIDARSAAALPVDTALAMVKPLLRLAPAGGPIIVVLEGISRADEQSLELIDRLAADAEAGSVLIIGIATEMESGAPVSRLPWLGREEGGFSPYSRIDVPPLSAVESRLMATQILAPLSPPPMRLVDLVVAEAEGNPLYIEAAIRLLMEMGVITVGERWRCDMVAAEATPLPPGISRMYEARIAMLPDLERHVLQRAAVFGPLCWDSALLEATTADPFDETDVEAALLSLEMKRYLIRDDIYSFGATQAYAFWRDTVRETVYRTVPEDQRRALHLEAAHWLVANENDARFSAWFPIDAMIARHFAAAGDVEWANVWRRRAGLAENES